MGTIEPPFGPIDGKYDGQLRHDPDGTEKAQREALDEIHKQRREGQAAMRRRLMDEGIHPSQSFNLPEEGIA